MERAERFGIVTKELSEKRIKERQERFGIQTKESIEAKKQERMKRFGNMEQASLSGITSEELEAKRKARMERFGKEAVQEAQRSVTQTAAEGDAEDGVNGFKMNRRKNKFNRKNKGQKTIVIYEGKNRGGDNHHGKRGRSFNNRGGGGNP